MDQDDLFLAGPSHGKPLITRVAIGKDNSFEADLENLVYDVLDVCSEPDPYSSDRDEENVIESERESESEQE